MSIQYRNHTLVVALADQVQIYRGDILVDWVCLPGRGLFRTMREAMRIVREEHEVS
jgi:hypothetical protein